MPTISVEQNLIAKLLAQHKLDHDIEQIADELPLLGTDIDRCDAQKLDIEIFPNRPDLLSGETLTRACLLYTSPSPRDRYGSRMPSSA